MKSYGTLGSLRAVVFSLALAHLSCAAGAQPPEFGEGENRGLLADDLITEASGLAASAETPGVLWTHNDSEDTTRIFAVGLRGEAYGTFHLEGSSARDWEDIAVGPGPDSTVSYLFVADIGDNNASYETKRIHRVAEPTVDTGAGYVVGVLRNVETITYRYPDGARDAECMMVDPLTRDLYVVSKREPDVRVYRAPWPQSTTETITLEYVATLDSISWVTAGDISSDGGEILIKNYAFVYYWERHQEESIAEAFERRPMLLPYLQEPQGEAIAWLRDGSGYYTVSEERGGIEASLWFYPRQGSAGVGGPHQSHADQGGLPDLTGVFRTEGPRTP